MDNNNNNQLCRESELFYFNFAFESETSSIPRHITEHIKGCSFCSTQIDRMQKSFSGLEADLPENTNKPEGLTEILKLHFYYIDKPVTCSVVRPFLPTFLEKTLKVTIPTPITVHLDTCEQCQKDLAALRDMDLENKQLRQLNMLLSYNISNNLISCIEAEAYLNDFVNMNWQAMDSEILKHLCKCADCQNKIYELRREKIDQYNSRANDAESLDCNNNLLHSDVFEYCYPFDIEPKSDQFEKFRTNVIKHIQNCPQCLMKLQNLHKAISILTLKPESGVVTHYSVSDTAQKDLVFDENDIYSDFPIQVEVSRQEENQELISNTHSAASDVSAKQARSKKIKLITRFAAAAVITLAAGLFIINMPTAVAVSVEKVYEVIASVKNIYIKNTDVHVESFLAEDNQLIQEKWVSRSLGLYLTRTGDDLILWDVNNAVRKHKGPNFGKVIESKLGHADIVAIRQRIKTSFGLMPFEKPSAIPKGHTWEQLYLEGLSENIEVFELSWTQKTYAGSSRYMKWRLYLDKTSHLPRKIEYYEKLPGLQNDYELVEIKEVSYFDDGEMESIINNNLR